MPETKNTARTTDQRPRKRATATPASSTKTSKLDLIVGRLKRRGGASLAELINITGWQAHSVRGALAGSLKKKGHAIVSETIKGERRYRIGDTP
ncbi:MAG: DUF3489 domain-containing protein [Devosia sp.]